MKTYFDPNTLDPRLTSVVGYTFGGWHHVTFQEHGEARLGPWCKFSVQHGLATWDFDNLTRLVLAAHRWAVRVELVQSGPRSIGIFLHARIPDDGTKDQSWSEKHPTIEQLCIRARELEARP